MGGGTVREFGLDLYTVLYLKWITNKDLLYSTGTLRNARWQLGWEQHLEENGYMLYVWLSPFAVHLRLSQHCLLISYTPIQNKNFKKIRKKKRMGLISDTNIASSPSLMLDGYWRMAQASLVAQR